MKLLIAVLLVASSAHAGSSSDAYEKKRDECRGRIRWSFYKSIKPDESSKNPYKQHMLKSDLVGEYKTKEECNTAREATPLEERKGVYDFCESRFTGGPIELELPAAVFRVDTDSETTHFFATAKACEEFTAKEHEGLELKKPCHSKSTTVCSSTEKAWDKHPIEFEH